MRPTRYQTWRGLGLAGKTSSHPGYADAEHVQRGRRTFSNIGVPFSVARISNLMRIGVPFSVSRSPPGGLKDLDALIQ